MPASSRVRPSATADARKMQEFLHQACPSRRGTGLKGADQCAVECRLAKLFCRANDEHPLQLLVLGRRNVGWNLNPPLPQILGRGVQQASLIQLREPAADLMPQRIVGQAVERLQGQGIEHWLDVERLAPTRGLALLLSHLLQQRPENFR